ncbi:hem-containing dehydratase protein [Aspergillus insuetus]
MPLLVPDLPERFTISTFGAQYHGDSLSESKATLIQQFETFLNASAVFVEDLLQYDTERGLGLSRIWISYWKSPEGYQKWWESPEVKQFWSSLPDDAGFWRERLHLPKTRFVTEMSQKIPSGSLHPWMGVPQPKQPSGALRHGRVQMTKFPDNICFVMEGQDHSSMKADETKLWSEKFNRDTKRYITNVVRSGLEAGMLITRLCHVPHSGKIKVKLSYTDDDPDIFPALDFNRTVEIFIFLQFRYMECAGRREKPHVALRRDFMEAYEPSGAMGHGPWRDAHVG